MYNKLHKIISFFIGAFLLLLLALIFTAHMDTVGSTISDGAKDCADGWSDASGREVPVSGIDGAPGTEFTFYRTLDLSHNNGESLCFISRNAVFSVYAGDRLIYDFHPAVSGFYGKTYGEHIHTVPLPSGTEEETVTLTGTVIYSNKWTGFEDIVLGDAGDHISGLVSDNAGGFVICLLIFGFGVVLFLFGVVENILHTDMSETIHLGVITMLLSLWTNSHTRILHIIAENPTALRIIDYVVICLLPIPVMAFVASFTKNLSHKVLNFCILLCILNFFFQAAGVLLGWFDYSDVLIISHIMILAGMLIISHLIINAVKENRIDRSQCTYLISALAIISCSGLADMVRYYNGHSSDFSHFTRVGLILFVGILTIYEFRQLVEVRLKSREAEVMHRLAMEDPLTGISSRTAFVAYEKLLMNKNTGVYLFIHFDVNFLKTVNDTYGHAEGDRHIIAAADVIRKSFGTHGHCFRVGGDEFFVILDGENCRTDYTDDLKKFLELQKTYNRKEKPPVPLVIAHGMAEYDCSSGQDPEAAERLADSRMYENKKQLKSEPAVK
ncbi:MAG: GGDEF domain-containing protein [Oscillospiraceae bacterium]|nr:GGDEF domain-containing protein [Oscillospiraceae bacterium]